MRVKWALGSTTTKKLVEVMEFQLSYLKILKDDAVKVLHSICQQIWKTQQWPQDWKRSVFIPIQRNERQCQRMFKLPYNCTNFRCQQGNVQKILQARLIVHEPRTSRCISWIQETPEEPEIKLPTSLGSEKKQGSSRKTSISASLTTLKPLTLDYNCGKFLKRWEYHTTLPAS